MTTRIVASCVLALGFPALAAAQPVSDASAERLSLDTAIRIAVENNRQLQSAVLQVRKADADVAAARTRRLPVFETELMASQLLTPVDFGFPQGAFGDYPGIGPIPSTDTTLSVPRQPTYYVSAQLSQPLSQLFRIRSNANPARLAHAISCSVSHRSSHALARRQSRFTVSGETPEHDSRLLDREAAEETQLDGLALPGIHLRQGEQGLVDRKKILVWRASHEECLVQRHVLLSAAAFTVAAFAGEIDQHLSHHPRRDAEEVCPVFPVDALCANQADVGLVDQRGGLEGVASALTAHIAPCQPPQLCVDQWDQPIQRRAVTGAARVEQRRHRGTD